MPIETLHITNLPADLFAERVAQDFPDLKIVSVMGDEEFAAAAPDMEAVLAFHPARGHWAKAEKLRFIQTIGAGVDAVLPAPDLALDVKIANARGVHAVQMGEFALAMMLHFAKDMPRIARQQAAKEWDMFFAPSLSGATCGILGLGAIGEAIAERAKFLGMRVIGTQRTPKASEHVEKIYSPEETGTVVAQADYLVLVLPLTEETRGLMDAAMLAKMKPDAVLINLSRGGVVDEVALGAALHDGKIKGAAMDVFEEEPLPAGNPLWDAPNLLITPHMAAVSDKYIPMVTEILIDNLHRLEAGEALYNEIDRERGY